MLAERDSVQRTWTAQPHSVDLQRAGCVAQRNAFEACCSPYPDSLAPPQAVAGHNPVPGSVHIWCVIGRLGSRAQRDSRIGTIPEKNGFKVGTPEPAARPLVHATGSVLVHGR